MYAFTHIIIYIYINHLFFFFCFFFIFLKIKKNECFVKTSDDFIKSQHAKGQKPCKAPSQCAHGSIRVMRIFMQ